MKYKIIVVFALLFQASLYSLASQDVKTNKHQSISELKRQAKQAQTVDQLHILAQTYRHEESLFKADAQQANEEVVLRSQQAGGRTLKYPSPVDSARYLYQYYAAKADEMGSKASLVDAQITSKR